MYLDSRGAVVREFSDFMVKLAAAFPTATLGAPTIRMYARALSDVPMAQLKAAAGRAVREAKFFPSVAELRSYVAASADDAAVLAWLAFRQAAESVGAYCSLEVEDAAAVTALRAVFGSWPEYCETEDGPAMHARKQEFLVAYREARRRTSGGGLLRLQGLCELSPRHADVKTLLGGRLQADGQVRLTAAAGRKALPERSEP